MNKTIAFLSMIIASLMFVLGATMQSRAQDKSFAGVIPFVTSNDRVGFFDQASGRVFLYDSNIEQCIFAGQMKTLGKSVDVITSQFTGGSN